MKKHLLLIATVGSILLVPALFADTTTGTGATNTGATSTGTTGTGTSNTGTTSTGATSTGTTSTGATATGTTNTGVTSTGTTSTGSTGTGMSCRIGSGSQMDILVVQEKFSLELTRLITEKKTAYLAARSLTGSAQVNALQVANLKFRTGYQIALKTMQSIKHEKRQDRLVCKIEKKIDKHDENKDDDDNKNDDDNNHDKKHEMKNIKKLFKEMKKMSKGNDR